MTRRKSLVVLTIKVEMRVKIIKSCGYLNKNKSKNKKEKSNVTIPQTNSYIVGLKNKHHSVNSNSVSVAFYMHFRNQSFIKHSFFSSNILTFFPIKFMLMANSIFCYYGMLCSIPIYVYLCVSSNIYLFDPHTMLHNLDNQFYIQRLYEIIWNVFI